VQRYTGRKINQVAIQENNRPGQEMSNSKLNIYRPNVTKNTELGQRPAPSKVVDVKEVKRPSERNIKTQPQEAGKPQNVNMQKDVNRSQNQPQNLSKPQNVNIQKDVNKSQNQPQNPGKPQNVSKSDNASQQPQTISGTPRKATTTSKASEQKKANPQQNKRTARQSAPVKPSENSKKEKHNKSQSVQDIKKNK
jgi:hypothetical protein